MSRLIDADERLWRDLKALEASLQAFKERHADTRGDAPCPLVTGVSSLTDLSFARVVEGILDFALITIDTDGCVASWNVGAERIKGYKSDEVLGKHASVFYPAESLRAGRPQILIERARRVGHAADEGWRIRRDGSRFWAEVTYTAIHDESGGLLGFVTLTRDLTARKRSEMDLAERNDTLDDRNEALNDLNLELVERSKTLAEQARALNTQTEELKASNERLQAIDALKDEFLDTLNHELRNPIGAVIGFAEILVDGLAGPLSDQQRKHMERLLFSARTMMALVNDLLDMSSIQAGLFHIRRGPTRVAGVVESVAAAHALAARDKQVTVAIAGAADVPEIDVDPQRIGQVVTNLLTNAIKFTPRGGRVTMTVSATAMAVRVEVADTGVGIAPADVPRLFQHFGQLEAGRRRGGTGLGLSISKALVEAHGGRIGVTSTPGEGATFWFELPRRAGGPQ